MYDTQKAKENAQGGNQQSREEDGAIHLMRSNIQKNTEGERRSPEYGTKQGTRGRSVPSFQDLA